MASQGPVVLILEDDDSLCTALVSFLKKKGIEAVATANAEEARRLLRANRIQVMMVDCLLPGENGVDFVQSLRKEFPPTLLDVVLMSGIFIEPQFIKDSIRQTQSSAFLKKPFELDDLLPYLSKLNVQTEAASPRKTLYQAFGNSALTDRDKKKILESLDDIHGFDLPFIYNFLIHSKISGHLNVVDERENVFGITFADGVIVGVDLADRDTFLGKLLIESGYILPEDLELVLNMKSSKRIGEKLIHNHLLSPHGFEIVLANQMSIRLSRTILDSPVKVNFVASEIEMMTPHVDGERLERFIHDWVAAKLTAEWLKAHFTPFGNSMVQKGPEFRLQHPSFMMPLVSNLERLVDVLLTGATLNEILDKRIYPEETLLKALHFLMCTGTLVLRERPRVRNVEDQKKHLKNIHHQLAGKNTVEAYELMVRMTTSNEQNPDLVFQEFVALLGAPPSSAQRDQVSIYNDIKNVAKAAFDAVKSGSHAKIKDELMRDDMEKKLKASQFFDQARGMLEKSQFGAALSALEKVEKLDPKFDKIRLHLVWARLGNIDNSPNKSAGFKTVDNDLMMVEPEDKFDALYSFVMGLYAKARGDYPGAKRSFEKAVAMDSGLIAARRELAVIATLNKPKQDVFNQDLKTLVGSLFKKK
ncbi:MAG: response regulator [Bdellovibrionaceae bacterium]|nr:response regulator [Pseudobdellovibrionaceae bacterium]